MVGVQRFLTQCQCRMETIDSTADQLVYNPFSQLISQLELYSQLDLSLQSDPIALCVLIYT